MNRTQFSGLFVIDDLGIESSGIYAAMLATVQEMRSLGHCPFAIGGVGSTENDLTPWQGMARGFERSGPISLGRFKGLKPWLQRHSADWDFVSVHSTWLLANGVVADWCRDSGKPLMLTVHGMFNPAALRVSRWKKVLSRRTLLSGFFEQIMCYQALSDAEYETLRQIGIRKPICVIGNGARVPAITEDFAALKRDDFGGNRRTLLYLGRLHPIKGVDRLIEAWQQATLGANWQLVIAGDGERGYRNWLESLVRCDGIRFIGMVTGVQKETWLRGCDAFVLPSHSEAFPVAAIEAWGYAKPVLLTDTCRFPAPVRAGAGIEVVSSVHGLMEGLQQLTKQTPNTLQTMGLRGRAFIQSEYGWDRICSKLVSVYSWMCDQGPAPDCLRFD